MAKGRPPVTGRFATRAELVDFVWKAYLGTTRTTSDVARAAQVGYGVVSRILRTKEGYDSAKYPRTSLTKSFRLESSLILGD